MDRALSQSKNYVSDSLGQKYAKPVIALLDVLHSESTTVVPMIGLLSMGSDPTSSIESLAKKMDIFCGAISMGQGQEVHARKLILEAMAKVSNCFSRYISLIMRYIIRRVSGSYFKIVIWGWII